MSDNEEIEYSLEWPSLWWCLTQVIPTCQAIQDELELEIGPFHPLNQLTPLVIAKSESSDEIIVTLNDGRFASVHLLWSSKIDQFPEKYPMSVIFKNAEDLQQYLSESDDERT